MFKAIYKYYPLFCYISLVIFSTHSFSETIHYPVSIKGNTQDNYHGIIIDDPYRGLEDLNSEQTQSWIKKQNHFTDSYLDNLPEQKQIKLLLEKIYNKENQSVPFRKKSKIFTYYNNGSWQQSKLFYQEAITDKKKLVIDPNLLSKDGTVSIGSVSVSPDSELIAYSISDGGSDWKTWKIKHIKSGDILEDTIKWSKFSNAEWAKDNSGFYYSGYSEPQKGDEYQELNRNQKLFFHTLGQPQSKNRLIYERPEHPEWGWGTTITEDGRFLILSVSEGTDERNRLFYKDLKKDESFVELIPDLRAQFTFLGNEGSIFLFFTNLDAPKGKVISIDINHPEENNWKVLIDEQNDVLTNVEILENYILCQYLKNVSSEVFLYEKESLKKKTIDFNRQGIISNISTNQDSDIFYFSYTNYIQPNQIYKYNAKNNDISLLWAKEIPQFFSDDYISQQVFYPTMDGTMIPMFISHHKDTELGVNTPLLLYGYGGFDISILPNFRERYLAWMLMGGVVAVPNIRGGGEYGEEWHQQGMLKNKQNVFDDFVSAAEYLHTMNISSPKKTVIEGRSNGGLLVGAAMLQRPNLFGATLPGVGVMDMLRFNKFTIGWAWESDYGSPERFEDFQVLVKYSPYHNIERGECYPPTLITTSELDDRVVPSHSYKFAARMQEAQNCTNPILIRIETRAGHGAGTPRNKTIEYISDVYGFALHYLLQN